MSEYVIDINNIDAHTLFYCSQHIKRSSCSCKKIDDDKYLVKFNLNEYSNSSNTKIIIPNILIYENYEVFITQQITIPITNNVKQHLDSFILDWIDDNKISNTKINITSILHHGLLQEIENDLELYYRLINFCKDNLEILLLIGLVYDFYKNDESQNFKLERSNIRFLKKIKMHNYSFQDVIDRFDNVKAKKSILNNFKCISKHNEFNFCGISFFKTFNAKPYLNHFNLLFLAYLERI